MARRYALTSLAAGETTGRLDRTAFGTAVPSSVCGVVPRLGHGLLSRVWLCSVHHSNTKWHAGECVAFLLSALYSTSCRWTKRRSPIRYETKTLLDDSGEKRLLRAVHIFVRLTPQ